jgi:translation initiation factor IF-2
MAKEKVYKLAQEFKVSSEALVQMLKTMGIVVKSHMSTVDESLRGEIKRRFDSEREEIKKAYDRKKHKIEQAREDQAVKAAEAAAAAAAPPPPTEQTAQTGPAAGAPQTPGPGSPLPAAHATPYTPLYPHAPALVRPAPLHRASSSAPGRPGQGIRTSDEERFPRRRPLGAAGGPPPHFTRNAPGAPPAPGSAPGGDAAGHRRRKPGKPVKPARKRNEHAEVDVVELKATIKRTMAQIGAGAERRKYKKDRSQTDDGTAESKKLLNVSEFVTVSELANMMQQTTSEVIAKCLELGLFTTVNQRLDFDTIALVADEFGFTAQLMAEYSPEGDLAEADDAVETLKVRAPIVTVMGHVDHGKTSLLDYIRKTNVIAGEAGGITQHIAAYEVATKQGPVTFLDTPGHEAFTAMRARGSQITDVVVLVVAADAGVMPQTKEAIDHAKAANVPIVVAVNKVDLPTANVNRVKAQLAEYSVLVDEYGGKVSCVEISARNGQGIDRLLETLALEAEILELKANPDRNAVGVVVESELDKGKGPIATVLVQKGTLRRGDAFVTGIHSGRVRDLFNERGGALPQAGPSQPVVVVGLSGTPQAGDSFTVVDDEKTAREISARRRLAAKERELRRIGAVSLDHLYEQIQAGKVQNLNLVIKGDVDGSVEALADSLEKLSNQEIKVRVIHKSVGAIKEADVMLAEASNALVIGFHLSPNPKIRDLAKREGVDIRIYRIIYEAVDAMRKAMEGMLTPDIKETTIGQVEVRKVFKISHVGNVAGCMVREGKITRSCHVRLIRDDVEVADTTLTSLKHNTDDMREVLAGHECGLVLAGVTEYREGDRVEAYEKTEVARKLTQSEPGSGKKQA